MNSITVGERLRAMRMYRDMSQAQLGSAVGRNRSQICRYEDGTEPSCLMLYQFAAVLRFSLDAFFAEHPHGFDARSCALENEGHAERPIG